MFSEHGAACWPTLMPKLFEWAQVCALPVEAALVSAVCRVLLPLVRRRSLSSESLHWGWAGKALCIAELSLLSVYSNLYVRQLINDG